MQAAAARERRKAWAARVRGRKGRGERPVQWLGGVCSRDERTAAGQDTARGMLVDARLQ